MAALNAPRAVLAWSGGKDSAWALHVLRRSGEVAVAALLTTVEEASGRTAVHGLPRPVLEAQAAAARLPVASVPLPSPCPNEAYTARMAAALAPLRDEGIRHVVFGDLFLADIRAWREAQMAEIGMEAVFPLWGRPTDALAREMIAGGLAARIVAVDTARLDAAFVGRAFDDGLLADLPAGVDPCGENGEFHTVVTDGPMFAAAIPLAVGAVSVRDGTARAGVSLS